MWVNGAKIIKKDLKASNGYIHIIDTVLFPPSSSVSRLMSTDSTLQRARNLFGAAVRKFPKGFTLFLPIDSAFQELLPAAYELLIRDPQKATVRLSFTQADTSEIELSADVVTIPLSVHKKRCISVREVMKFAQEF